MGLLDAVDVVRRLLERGADPNARLKKPILQRHHTFGDGTLGEGATPLMRAAKSGDIELMRVLLAAGADPQVTLPNGTTALMLAAGLGWRNGSPLAPSYDQGSEAEAVETLELLLVARARPPRDERGRRHGAARGRRRAAAPRRSCVSCSSAAPIRRCRMAGSKRRYRSPKHAAPTRSPRSCAPQYLSG